ncbi:MAG: hypothetical protein V7739_11985 [Motiliproteus sp.]
MALRTLTLSILITLTALLSGCSGHPGAGHWVASKANAAGYWVIVVEFDGKVKVLSKSEEKPVMGCYWQASTGDTMMFQCASKENPETPENYLWTVSTADIATLSKDGKALAEFRRRM